MKLEGYLAICTGCPADSAEKKRLNLKEQNEKTN
jgi:hypothetical protein